MPKEDDLLLGLFDDDVPRREVDTTPRNYTLNAGQQEAFDVLVDTALGRTDYNRIVLVGYAGTGKTFLINRVIERVRKLDNSINIGITAPTHKAVRVIKKNSELKNVLDFGTIHSFFALKETINEKTGKIEYKPDFDSKFERKIDSIDLLLVDETSMLQDDLYEIVESQQRTTDLIVIFIGDSLQIPPVGKLQNTGEGVSIPLNPVRQKSHKIAQVELTEPQRQAADSPIIMYAHAIRENIRKQHIPWEFKEEHKDSLELISLGDGPNGNIEALREVFKLHFDTDAFRADPDYAKVVAWRNDTVRYFNREIRQLMYKSTELPKILEGEKMVMAEPIVVNNKVLISKNEEVVISKVVVTNFKLGYKYKAPAGAFSNVDNTKEFTELDLKVYKLLLTTPEGFSREALILHEDSEKAFEDAREKVRIAAVRASGYDRKDMYKSFYEMPKKFAWVDYNYAITAHKSQGSTYKYCISMEWDTAANRNIEERNRLNYVAATRASTKVYVVRM